MPGVCFCFLSGGMWNLFMPPVNKSTTTVLVIITIKLTSEGFWKEFSCISWSFPLTIFSVNATKSTVYFRFGHITEEVLNRKIRFLCGDSTTLMHCRARKGLLYLFNNNQRNGAEIDLRATNQRNGAGMDLITTNLWNSAEMAFLAGATKTNLSNLK